MKKIRIIWALGAFLFAAGFAPHELQAQATGIVEGTVVTAEGEPVADARVEVAGSPRSTATAEDGTFRIAGLPAGSHLIEASSSRSGRQIRRVSVGANETVEITIRLDPLYHLDELVVSGGRERTRSETYQSTDVVGDREIAMKGEATLGETLAQEPGITSSYFGPGSSRPVIRGLGSNRVRVLESGVTTGDASTTSPDHAVSLEPVSADRIEIVRGPATLLYGSSAVGGVVNVFDGRIPRDRPRNQVEAEAHVLGSTVSEEFTGGGSVDLQAGPFVIHGSGLRRSTNDVNIPEGAFAEHEEEGEHGHEEEEGHGHEEEEADHEEGPIDELEDSFVETTRGAVGLSYVDDRGFLGVSWSAVDQLYGVPGGHGHVEEDEHGHEEEAGHEEEPGHEEEEGQGHGEEVAIDLRQRRVDVEGALEFSHDVFQRIKARFGITDYRHFELEGGRGGEIGTRFDNEEWELRGEAEHRLFDRIDGTLGFQVSDRDFSAVGEEAFILPNETDQFAIFLLEELETGPVRYQLGGRFESQNVDDLTTNRDLDHEGFSVSGGVNWSVRDEVTFALTLARSVKLPTAEELFSNGAHLATRSFEVGNVELDEEKAFSSDASIRVSAGPVEGEVTGFVNRFDDFIFQDFTGEEEEELPVLLFRQADALFAGVESRAEVDVLHEGDHHLALTGRLDWVRATLTGPDEALPRIPPLRVGGGFRYDFGPLRATFDVLRNTAQDRVARFETETEGYTMVNASAAYRLFTHGVAHEIVLRGTNLADVVARNHVSLIKEQAPLPGRSVRVMYRLLY